MKKVFFVSLLSIALFTACSKYNIAANTPSCVREEIKQQKDDGIIGSIDEYFYQNRLVYAFAPDGRIIADAPTEIKDADCNTICNVGGFGGPSVNLCNGDNFFQTATFKRNIWKKK